jgi:MSHA biogenesis protein MshI
VFGFNKRKKKRAGRLGIEISPVGIAVATIKPGTDDDKEACECYFIEGTDLAENGRALKQYINNMECQDLPTNIVLHPSMYKLFYVRRPDVDEADLSDAVKWQLKDQIDGSLSNVLVDCFSLPEDAFRGSDKMVYAVVAERSLVEEATRAALDARVDVKSVDICELAMRNIVNMLEADTKGAGAALLHMRNSDGTINLSQGGDLYLTRQLESGLTMLEMADVTSQEEMLDELLLEIQRSLDYYDNQLRKGNIRNVVLGPTRLDSAVVGNHLKDRLGVDITVIDLNELFEMREPISGELQNQCFSAVGAAHSQTIH